jgi:hypothetical protein
MPQVEILGKKIGTKEGRIQPAHLHTEDRRIVEADLDVVYGCVEAPTWEQSWAQSQDALCTSRGNDRDRVLVVNERSFAPISSCDSPKDFKALLALRNQIARESRKRSHFHADKGKKKETFAGVIKFVVVLLALMVVVTLVIGMLSSGKYQLPW